jgi:hypothetical protein
LYYINKDGGYRTAGGYYYTNTYVTYSSATWSSTLMYFKTTQGNTYISSPYSSSTLTISYYSSYIYSKKLKTTNTKSNIIAMTYYSTDTLYSTITIKLMPSPSPKTILNDKLELNADLLLITINPWIL